MPGETISLADDPAAIARCHAVMRELRAHFADEAVFVETVRRQQTQGYRLAFVEASGEVRAVAGYRLIENLFAGKTLYVDDLVSREADRSQGYGGKLIDWLVERAREEGCQTLTLDSGVQRFGAHRFYLRKGMDILAHHFSMKLDAHRAEENAECGVRSAECGMTEDKKPGQPSEASSPTFCDSALRTPHSAFPSVRF